jgi:ankyrin repeat protein
LNEAVKAGVDLNSECGTREGIRGLLLNTLIKRHQLNHLEVLLRQPNIELENVNLGQNPLVVAALELSPGGIELLLEAKANPSPINEKLERPPLHAAIYRKNFECVELLLHAKANPNVLSSLGHTALTCVASYDIRMLNILLKHGADPCISASGGTHPLCISASGGTHPLEYAIIEAIFDVPFRPQAVAVISRLAVFDLGLKAVSLQLTNTTSIGRFLTRLVQSPRVLLCGSRVHSDKYIRQIKRIHGAMETRIITLVMKYLTRAVGVKALAEYIFSFTRQK